MKGILVEYSYLYFIIRKKEQHIMWLLSMITIFINVPSHILYCPISILLTQGHNLK